MVFLVALYLIWSFLCRGFFVSKGSLLPRSHFYLVMQCSFPASICWGGASHDKTATAAKETNHGGTGEREEIKRGFFSLEVKNTMIVWTFFQDQILCPFNRGVAKERFYWQCHLVITPVQTQWNYQKCTLDEFIFNIHDSHDVLTRDHSK